MSEEMQINKLTKEFPHLSLNVNVDDLKEFMSDLVRETTETVIEKSREKANTRSDTLERFGICSATLWRWEKLGLIKGKKIGRRKYYLESEIKKILAEEQ